MERRRYITRKEYNEYFRKYRKLNRKKIRKYLREYMRRERKILGYLAHTTAKKYYARKKVQRAVLLGKIKKLPCEKCGNEKSVAHHPNYNYPLKVKWLCISCHNKLHFKKKNENELMVVKFNKNSKIKI